MEHTAEVDFSGDGGPVGVATVDGFVFGQSGERVDEELGVGRVEGAALHNVADIHTGEGEIVVFACRHDAFDAIGPVDAGTEIDDAGRHFEEVGLVACAKVEVDAVVFGHIGAHVGSGGVVDGVGGDVDSRGVVHIKVQVGSHRGVVGCCCQRERRTGVGEVEVADKQFDAGANGQVVIQTQAKAQGAFAIDTSADQVAVEKFDDIVAGMAVVAFAKESYEAARHTEAEVDLGLCGEGQEELAEVETESDGVDVGSEAYLLAVREGVENAVGVDVGLIVGRVVMEYA